MFPWLGALVACMSFQPAPFIPRDHCYPTSSRSALVYTRAQSVFKGDRKEENDDEDVDDMALTKAKNRFFEALYKIEPPQLIQEFAETAPADVQAAIRQTMVSLMGNLPSHLYETNIMSTGQNVASLMYSMQVRAPVSTRLSNCCRWSHCTSHHTRHEASVSVSFGHR